MSATLTILLNGEVHRSAEGTSVGELLAELGRHPRTVAVELNGRILPRQEYDSTLLSDADRVEVVGFVQGG